MDYSLLLTKLAQLKDIDLQIKMKISDKTNYENHTGLKSPYEMYDEKIIDLMFKFSDLENEILPYLVDVKPKFGYEVKNEMIS